VLKSDDIAWVFQKGLSHHQSMLCIVADHNSSKDKTHTPLSIPASLDFAPRQALCGQPQRVAHRIPQQEAGELPSKVIRWIRLQALWDREWKLAADSLMVRSHFSSSFKKLFRSL
jgi:hypothetical protein